MNREEAADLSTSEIVAMVRDGNHQAFRHIVNRYQDAVMAIAHAMLRDRDTTEDVGQQVFVRAFQHLDRFDENSSFGLWIKGIARNVVREELRKKYRYRGRIEAYARLVEQRLAESAGRDPFGEEAREALEACLAQLEETAERSIRMHYLERKKTDEIAQILDRTPGSVRTLMHRARSVLRDCLVEKGAVS